MRTNRKLLGSFSSLGGPPYGDYVPKDTGCLRQAHLFSFNRGKVYQRIPRSVKRSGGW